MAFLIVHDDKQFTDILSAELGREFSGEVHCKENGSEAKALIELLDNFHFVICQDKTNKDDTAEKILTFVKSHKELSIKPHIIVLGKKVKPVPGMTPIILPRNVKISGIIHLIKTHRSHQSNLEKIELESSKEFVSIPVRLLEYIPKPPADIYLKLKNDDEFRYLKRYNRNETFESADLQSLISKGLKNIYVLKEHKKDFYNVLDKRIAELAKKHPGTFVSESDLENYAFYTLNNIGLSKSSLEVAQEAARESQKKLLSNNNFQKTLKEVLGHQKLGMKQLKSKCIILLAHTIIKGHPKLAGTNALSHITNAAYFHDILLSDNYSFIRSQAEVDSLYLKEKENILIDQHAAKAASDLEKYDSISSEVIKIVKQHHGTLEGKGFTRKIHQHLGPLSLCFLIAEEIAVEILTSEKGKLDISTILEDIYDYYEQDPRIEEYLESFQSGIS